MALRWQKFNMLFNGGRDAKSDQKNIPLNQFKELKNVYQQKTGKISKRNGYTSLGNNIYGSEDTLDNPKWTGTYKKELLTIADGTNGPELYSYSESINEHVRKGPVNLIDVKNKDVQTSSRGRCALDSIVNGGLQFYAWCDDYGIRYSVYDLETETTIIAEKDLLDFGDTLQTNYHAYITVRLATAGDYVFIFYSDPQATTSVECAIIDISDPETITTTTTIDSNISPLIVLDAIGYDDTACVYAHITNTNGQLTFGYIKTDGAVGNGSNGYPAEVNFTSGFSQFNSISLAVQPNTNDIFVAISERTSGTTHRINIASFTDTTLANDLASTTVYTRTLDVSSSISLFSRVALIFKSETEIKIVTEELDFDADGIVNAQLKRCTLIECDDTGGSSTNTVIKNRCQLLTKPWAYNNNVYVNLGYLYSDHATFSQAYQMTGFTVRLDDSVDNGTYQIVSKFLTSKLWYTYNDFGLRYEQTPNITLYENGKHIFASFTSTGRVNFDLEERMQDNTKITLVELDLAPSKTINSAEQNNVLLLTGSDLLVYDGTVVNEVGFHIYPDSIQIESDSLGISVVQQGTAGLPEITDITLISGAKISDGQSFFLRNSSNIAKEVQFTVDDLTGSNTEYDAFINSYDSAIEVAKKVVAELNTGSDFTAAEAPSGYPTIRVTNAANGVCDDASNATSLGGVGRGEIEDGTYQYKAIYEWEDAQGNIYRSAPSPTASITLNSGSSINSVGIIVPSLQFTRKYQYISGVPVSEVRIVVYRTEAGGSIFYRIGDQEETAFPNLTVKSYVPNQISQPWVGFHDITPDSLINTNEILYTNSGAVVNVAPPSPSAITSYRNRIVLGGFAEYPNEIWFSKELVTQEGINFNDTFTKKIDPFGGDIKALTMMDEKLIIFEENATLYMLGTGPDDLGLNDSLSDAEFISRDNGTSNQNSVAVVFGQGGAEGILFKSKKGWYRLTRGLGMDYVGSMVEDFNDSTVAKAVSVPNTHHVRIIHSDADCIVYDHYYQQWYRWTNHNGVGATFFDNKFTYLRTDGEVYKELSTGDSIYADDDTAVLIDITTAWLQLGDISGFQRIKKLMALGEFNVNFTYTWKFYFDHVDSSSQDVVGPAPVNNEEMEIFLPRQKCKALQIRLVETETTPDKGNPFDLSSLLIEAGIKKGFNKIADSGRAG